MIYEQSSYTGRPLGSLPEGDSDAAHKMLAAKVDSHWNHICDLAEQNRRYAKQINEICEVINELKGFQRMTIPSPSLDAYATEAFAGFSAGQVADVLEGTTLDKIMQFRLEPDIAARLRDYATRNDTTVSALIRAALVEKYGMLLEDVDY